MPSISQQAIATIRPQDRPISELFRLAGDEFCDKEAAAHLMEELKTTVLEQWKNEVVLQALAEGRKLADNAAERTVKAEPRWEKYIRETCAYRLAANRAKVAMKELEMRHSEWITKNANLRKERELTR